MRAFSAPPPGLRGIPPALPKAPFPSSQLFSSERKLSVKGAPLLRGLRTLDRLLPFWNMDPEGKGAGGLRGLAPWRSMRQRLMRAFSAPLPRRIFPSLLPCELSSDCILPVDSCAFVAMLPSALCRRPLPPQVPIGVLNSRSAAISVST
jgi:hypothetical protein